MSGRESCGGIRDGRRAAKGLGIAEREGKGGGGVAALISFGYGIHVCTYLECDLENSTS